MGMRLYVQIAVEVNLYNDVHSCIDMINQEGFKISQTEVIDHYKSMYMYLYLSDNTSQDICFHAATACNVIPLNMHGLVSHASTSWHSRDEMFIYTPGDLGCYVIHCSEHSCIWMPSLTGRLASSWINLTPYILLHSSCLTICLLHLHALASY